MKVLIADAFEQSGIDGLKAAGFEVVVQPDLDGDRLADALTLTRADVLIVRSTAVTASTLERAGLSLIVRAGAGYNTIDVSAASRRGIYVSNCPGRNAVTVAELTMGLILALDRRIPDNVADLRDGRWNKKEYAKARGIHGRTIGLIGFGNIGREVASRALAFGLSVVVWSRRFAEGDAVADLPVVTLPTIDAVAEQADIVSLHLALTSDTRGVIDKAFFDRMKTNAMFINTARAELVDYSALQHAVSERGLRVGIDVFPDEPASGTATFASELAALPGVYGTHHIGASTEQAQEAIAAETVRIVRAYASTGKVPNVVNLARQTPATHTLVVRHRDRPGVLAHVFDLLREQGINVQETDNVIFDGAEAAVARINVDGMPAESTMRALSSGHVDILEVRLIPIQS